MYVLHIHCLVLLCMHTNVLTYAYVCTTYMHCVHIFVRICTCVRACMHTYRKCSYVFICICIHIYVYAVHVYIRSYVCICLCSYIHMYACMCVCISPYISIILQYICAYICTYCMGLLQNIIYLFHVRILSTLHLIIVLYRLIHK